MSIRDKELAAAVKEQIISPAQAEQLSAFLRRQPAHAPRFDFTHILYYLGGLIAIGAMTLFMNLGWESFGGWGVMSISIAYALIGLALCHHFQHKGYAVPAGICATFAVALTPLAIYGLQQALGFWPEGHLYRDYHRYIEWHWLYMELGTLAVGIIIAWRYRYPFLVMPIAITLWYLSMDLTPMLAEGHVPFELRALVSMYFGLLMLLIAFWVDLRARNSADYAFWLYLFGVLAFWGGMTAQDSNNELSKFIYCCINLLMIGIGAVLLRRVFVVFGALGTSFYLGHLASSVFADSWLFPFTLTAIGLGIVYLGIIWQKHEAHLSTKIRRFLPQPLQELLESKQA